MNITKGLVSLLVIAIKHKELTNKNNLRKWGIPHVTVYLDMFTTRLLFLKDVYVYGKCLFVEMKLPGRSNKILLKEKNYLKKVPPNSQCPFLNANAHAEWAHVCKQLPYTCEVSPGISE